MSTPSSAASGIEAATALLQSELAELQGRQEALQEEQQSIQAQLAAVSGKIESIRGALTALRTVSSTAVSVPHEANADSDAAAAATHPPTGTTAQPAEEEIAARGKGASPRVNGAKRTQASPEPERRASQTHSTAGTGSGRELLPEGLASESRFTDQVIAVLTRNSDTVLRARDIAEVLGRDKDAGSINAVRSTLDRLVATSRAHRVGRGLYQAPAA
ncbi:hypothetical protein ACGFYA_29745 [Streptomyces sp. NPDC048305]|uniref:hypothetical protein n=1 Tax=Streptomyces sp. NPDC048305 TaxID=3365532 RepID=UPI003710B70E